MRPPRGLAPSRATATRGAVPRFVGPRLGRVTGTSGAPVHVEVSLEAGPAVLYDAVILPDGAAADALARDARSVEFVRDQYRHCKTILAIGAAKSLLSEAGIAPTLPSGGADPGVLVAPGGGDATALAATFLAALARHKHYERETDPPRV